MISWKYKKHFFSVLKMSFYQLQATKGVHFLLVFPPSLPLELIEGMKATFLHCPAAHKQQIAIRAWIG